MRELITKIGGHKLQMAIVVIAVVVAAWLAASLVLRVVAPGFQVDVGTEPLRPVTRNLRFAWFPQQTNGSAQEQPEPSGEALRQASLNASLQGILIQGGEALAAIQTSQDPEGLYRVGDRIAGRAEVLRIEPHRVVISEGGEERQLSWEKDEGEQDQDKEPQGLVERVQQSGTETESGFDLAGVVSASPTTKSGHGMAVKLDSVGEEVQEITGLQAGDIILSVDGKPMAQLMASPANWEQIRQQSMVAVELERDGERMKISINARSLGERILPDGGQ